MLIAYSARAHEQTVVPVIATNTSGARNFRCDAVEQWSAAAPARMLEYFDDASLQKVVQRSEELAQLAPENPEHMPLLGPQTFADSILKIRRTESAVPGILTSKPIKSWATSWQPS